ncbi:MAG: trimethylamine methyltransferase family protein [Actinobacteria bacterium]|nr:trimethylamine methyltransferase family protein [Actinomycetota bacterium]
MKPISQFYKLLTENELDEIHEKVVDLLSDPGMKFENQAMLEALQKKGAKVDFANQIAKIKKNLIEETII